MVDIFPLTRLSASTVFSSAAPACAAEGMAVPDLKTRAALEAARDVCAGTQCWTSKENAWITILVKGGRILAQP